MKFINFAVVKFSACIVMGILAAHFFPTTTISAYLVLPLLFGVLILWFYNRKQLIETTYFGIAAYLCFFAIGYYNYQVRLPHFQTEHFSHIINANDDFKIIQLKITEVLKPDTYNTKYFSTVNAIQGEAATGKILLQISKDSSNTSFSVDDILLVYGAISKIPEPLNPHQFDYSEYMKSLSVYGQIKISEKEIVHTTTGRKTLFGIAQNFRSTIVSKLQKTELQSNERAIIQALVLGEKKDIDTDLYNAYAAAGAVHILAVSGLHVGILYLVLAFLLKPFLQIKYGAFLHAFVIVLLLWGFALLSGLSPSVTRAVTMFSFFAVAKLLNRETNSINTLFLSFLTLLLINPLWLFQVGFQLSFLAVFFIVWLQPLFYKVGFSKYTVVRKIWGIITVTLCAQIGVLPLSLYYFHQFPGLFLLTNIVVLPLLTVLMCGGILIVILAALQMLPHWLAQAYNAVIESLNNFITWVSVQDEFLFKSIHFSEVKVLGAYILIIAVALFFKKMKYRKLMVSLLAFAAFITIYIFEDYRTSNNQLVVFQKNKQTLIGYKNGKKLIVYKSDTISSSSEIYPIKSFKTAVNSTAYSEELLPKVFQYKRKTILVLDSLGVFPTHKKVHTIILTHSPKVNLNRLIDSLQPKQIIADGSNYFTYVTRWEKSCKLKKLPFCHTAKQGAFPID
ncbi:ComEC/Rec2 family competence protein [Aequorivita flava]|uniref:ComEC/Rec2 family competence protein n=1 Tax=Aequorivita flava TaxID=3114371 RepID=A0AB35YXX4_9FLAO